MCASYDDVIKRLKEERIKLSLSQDEMASLIHITQSSYSKIELGLRRLSFGEMKYLCDSNLDTYYIFTGLKSKGKYVEILSSCSFTEVCGYLRLIYDVMLLRKGKWSEENWKKIRKRLSYIRLSEDNQKTKELLVALRHSMNYQQKRVAYLLGIDIKKYRDLEKGRCLLDSELIWRLYDTFLISPVMLLNDRKGLINELSLVLEVAETQNDNLIFAIINELRDKSKICQ